jgi:3-oxoadipate enol-lactonase
MLEQEFSGFVEANGLRLYAERKGTGDTLLYISGTGADLRNTPNQFDSPFGQHFDLVSFDQRGLGQSENPPRDYTMMDYANDAAAVLDMISESETVRVIGVSFGGMVAQELAIRYPHKIRSLVLACTSSGGEGQPSYPLHELEALETSERIRRNLQITDTRRTDQWISDNPESWQKLVTLSLASRRADRDEEGAVKQLNARKLHDTFDRLEALTMPVLLAGGRYDGIAPPENMRALRDALPNAELRLYDGGHLFFLQDKRAYPDMVNWLLSH